MTRIVTILGEETLIQHYWTEVGSPKLKLFTLGMTKMYKEEVDLEQCTVEDIVTLFEYRAPTEDHEPVLFLHCNLRNL